MISISVTNVCTSRVNMPGHDYCGGKSYTNVRRLSRHTTLGMIFFFNFWQILLKIGIFPSTPNKDFFRLRLTRQFRFIRVWFSLLSVLEVQLGVYLVSQFLCWLYEIMIFKRFPLVTRRSCIACSRGTWLRLNTALPFVTVRFSNHHWQNPLPVPTLRPRPNYTTHANVLFSHIVSLHQVRPLRHLDCCFAVLSTRFHIRNASRSADPFLAISFELSFHFLALLHPHYYCNFPFWRCFFFCKTYTGFFSLNVLISLVISFSSAIVSAVRVTVERWCFSNAFLE